MGVKEILGYICLAGGVISFVAMYLVPRFNRRKGCDGNRASSPPVIKSALSSFHIGWREGFGGVCHYAVQKASSTELTSDIGLADEKVGSSIFW